jgi:hypothetical protein
MFMAGTEDRGDTANSVKTDNAAQKHYLEVYLLYLWKMSVHQSQDHGEKGMSMVACLR